MVVLGLTAAGCSDAGLTGATNATDSIPLTKVEEQEVFQAYLDATGPDATATIGLEVQLSRALATRKFIQRFDLSTPDLEAPEANLSPEATSYTLYVSVEVASLETLLEAFERDPDVLKVRPHSPQQGIHTQ